VPYWKKKKKKKKKKKSVFKQKKTNLCNAKSGDFGANLDRDKNFW